MIIRPELVKRCIQTQFALPSILNKPQIRISGKETSCCPQRLNEAIRVIAFECRQRLRGLPGKMLAPHK